jgi:hypothetical protein
LSLEAVVCATAHRLRKSSSDKIRTLLLSQQSPLNDH